MIPSQLFVSDRSTKENKIHIINYDYSCTFPAIYLSVIIVLCGCSLVCTAIVMNVYLRDPPVPMSPLMRRIVFGIVGRLVCYKHQNRVEPESSGVEKYSRDLMTTDHDMESEKKNEDFTENILATNHDQLICDTRKHRVESAPSNVERSSPDRTISEIESEQKHGDFNDNVITINNEGQLLVGIRKLTQQIEENQETDNLKYEWKEAGRVMDRVFLIIFGMATFLTLTILFAG